MITILLKYICRLIFRVQITGIENLPKKKIKQITANY